LTLILRFVITERYFYK